MITGIVIGFFAAIALGVIVLLLIVAFGGPILPW